jgi:hypothetical protein
VATASNLGETNVMARRNLPPTPSRTDLPVRLTDVDVIEEGAEGIALTRIDGGTIATLLDVVPGAERLLNAEAISLELENVADLVGALAEGAEPPTAGALSLAEHRLRHLALRVDALRPGAQSRARRFVIAPGVREVLRDYAPRWPVMLPRADAEPTSTS